MASDETMEAIFAANQEHELLDKLVPDKKPVDKPHTCSYASSNRIGSLGFGVVLFECRVCGKEWEKDVS